jgi:aminoglycoside/choline kinase family phosphotransferase
MSGIVEKRADDTIAPMQATSSSPRRQALQIWVDHVLAERGSTPSKAWRAIVGDASFRRFYRLHADDRDLIAMDAPPATENNAQFVRLSKVFRDAGICVPDVIASDLDNGFMLVSDLGDLLYADVYATPERDLAIERALDTLISIARVGDAGGVVPPYTTQRFRDELALFETWFVDGMLQHRPTVSERGMLDATKARLIDAVESQPKVCVHRDYHSRNLLWGPDEVTRVVDFQDALHGPLLYDIASLLRDCYVRFDEADIARWRDVYRERAVRAGLPIDDDREELRRRIDWTAVQRQLKAVGIFARLELRDSRSSHLVDIEPVLDHLVFVCRSYADLAPLGNWIAGTITPKARSALAARGVSCAQ